MNYWMRYNQVANLLGRRASVRIYEITDPAAKSRVIEGHEPHARTRVVFHDQYACIGIELRYFC
jgi:hypothetical protein